MTAWSGSSLPPTEKEANNGVLDGVRCTGRLKQVYVITTTGSLLRKLSVVICKYNYSEMNRSILPCRLVKSYFRATRIYSFGKLVFCRLTVPNSLSEWFIVLIWEVCFGHIMRIGYKIGHRIIPCHKIVLAIGFAHSFLKHRVPRRTISFRIEAGWLRNAVITPITLPVGNVCGTKACCLEN